MSENPRFMEQFKDLADKNKKEVTFTTHAQIVKIQNPSGQTFYGIMMDKSVAIPFTSGQDTDENIKNLVFLNTMDLKKDFYEAHAQAACKALNLPFNGETNGLYSDGNTIANTNINILHIYPKEHISSQEKFLEKLSQMLLSKKCTMTVEES